MGHKLAFIVYHIRDGIPEVTGHQTVQYDLSNGLLPFLALPSGFHIDKLRQELGLLVGQLQRTITGFHILPNGFLVDKGFLRHLTGVKNKCAVIAPANLVCAEAILKAIL